jgi:hypothetical protein
VLLHESVDGSDYPLVRADGTTDIVVLAEIEKFQAWCVQPTFLWDRHPEILAELRRAGLKLFAHILVGRYWPVNNADRTSYQARVQDVVGDRYFRRPDGLPWDGHCARITDYPVRADLMDLWTEVLGTGLFDGALLDAIPPSNTWRTVGEPIDYMQAGFTSLEAWDLGMRTAQGHLCADLRTRFPNLTFIGNGGPRGSYEGGQLLNGWWQENWPFQPPATWIGHMTGAEGFLSDPGFYQQPTNSVIAVACSPGLDPQRARLGLASTCMGEGWFTVGPGNYDVRMPYRRWWLREYGVDRTTGASLARSMPYLGRATTPAYQQDGAWLRQFVFGLVIANPGIASAGVRLPFKAAPIEEPALAPIDYEIVLPGDASFLLRA